MIADPKAQERSQQPVGKDLDRSAVLFKRGERKEFASVELPNAWHIWLLCLWRGPPTARLRRGRFPFFFTFVLSTSIKLKKKGKRPRRSFKLRLNKKVKEISQMFQDCVFDMAAPQYYVDEPCLMEDLTLCLIKVLTENKKKRDVRIRDAVAAVRALGAFENAETRKDLIKAVDSLFGDPDKTTGGINTPTFMHALQMFANLAKKSFGDEIAKDVENYIEWIE